MRQHCYWVLFATFVVVGVAHAKDPIDYYKALSTNEFTTPEKLPQAFSAAYKKVFAKYDAHPYEPNDLKKVPLKELLSLIEAYEVLSDPTKRAAYDKNPVRSAGTKLPSNIEDAGNRVMAIDMLARVEADRVALEKNAIEKRGAFGKEYTFVESVLLSEHVLKRMDRENSAEVARQIREDFLKLHEKRFSESKANDYQTYQFAMMHNSPSDRKKHLATAWDLSNHRGTLENILVPLLETTPKEKQGAVIAELQKKLANDPKQLSSIMLTFMQDKEKQYSIAQRELAAGAIANYLEDTGHGEMAKKVANNYTDESNPIRAVVLGAVGECAEAAAAAN